jgi:hypothetical protein
LVINLFYEKVFKMQWWVGKIALFGKALVSVWACGALPMCAMWVGFSSFLWMKKNKINFYQICTVLSKS